jgi:hypothetical protein
MVRHAIMCSDYPRRQSLGVATSRYCAPHGRPEIAMELPQPAVPDNAKYWSIMRTAVAVALAQHFARDRSQVRKLRAVTTI